MNLYVTFQLKRQHCPFPKLKTLSLIKLPVSFQVIIAIFLLKNIDDILLKLSLFVLNFVS